MDAAASRFASPSASEKATASPHRHHLPPTLNGIDIQSKCQSSLFSRSASSPPEAAFRGLSLVTDEGLSLSDTPAFKTCDKTRTPNHLDLKYSALRSDGPARLLRRARRTQPPHRSAAVVNFYSADFQLQTDSTTQIQHLSSSGCGCRILILADPVIKLHLHFQLIFLFQFDQTNHVFSTKQLFCTHNKRVAVKNSRTR